MKTILLDIDDTYVDSEKYLRQILRENGILIKSPDSIYSEWKREEYKTYFRQVFDYYEAIPRKPDADFVISSLREKYEVVFCTACTTDTEIASKKELAISMGLDIIICDNEHPKYRLDMNGCIIIDDNVNMLKKCNASKKIQMYNPYVHECCEDAILVNNWKEIAENLL